MDLPTLTKKDEDDLVHWGIPNDIDFIAASFVRKGQDLDNIRRVCGLPRVVHLPSTLAAWQILDMLSPVFEECMVQGGGVLPAVDEGS